MRQSRKRQRACGLIPIRRPVGAWEVDRKRWPKGLREATDFLHSHGAKAITWFQPERVAGGTWLAENHPEWIMGGAGGGILKIGEPECRKWITDRVDKVLTEEGIVQAFRRKDCAEESQVFKLRGLDPKAVYTVADLDTGKSDEFAGRELTDEGLRVTLADRPGAAVFTYRRMK